MPARVTIEATVWGDSRYHVLGAMLGCTHYEAIGRMAAIWGECTEQETDRLDSVFLGVHLGCASDRVAEILTMARLGEDLGEGLVRVRGCAGRTEWLAAKRANGRKGGRKRTESEPRANRERTESEPTRNPPAPAPAPAPAMPPSGGETRARAGRATSTPPVGQASATASPNATGLAVLAESGGSAPSARTATKRPATGLSSRPTGDRYSELYLAWEAMGKQRAGPAFGRVPGEIAGRSQVAACLASDLLVGRSDDDIRHGLAMLAAEAEARARNGDPDAWRWYRQAWSPRTMASAIQLPDEAAARAKAGDDLAGAGRAKRPARNPIAAIVAEAKAAQKGTP